MSVHVQVLQGDLLIGVHILSREVDVITLKVVLDRYQLHTTYSFTDLMLLAAQPTSAYERLTVQ